VAARLAGLASSALAGHEEAIRSLSRLSAADERFTASASFEAEGITVEIDLAGAVDLVAERKRLDKDLAAARKEAAQVSAKLGNANFTAKAPADVVAQAHERLATADITRLEARLATLPAG
jgi:valyl-tRNA synthetase